MGSACCLPLVVVVTKQCTVVVLVTLFSVAGSISAAWKSHPTVGVALFEPKVSDQLSSLSEELPVNMKKLLVYSL